MLGVALTGRRAPPPRTPGPTRDRTHVGERPESGAIDGSSEVSDRAGEEGVEPSQDPIQPLAGPGQVDSIRLGRCVPGGGHGEDASARFASGKGSIDATRLSPQGIAPDPEPNASWSERRPRRPSTRSSPSATVRSLSWTF